MLHIQPSSDDIQDVVFEWFLPNPAMDNKCVHLIDNKYGEAWRTTDNSSYQIRKCNNYFYVHLMVIEVT